jgi:hypothetical protein
MMERSIWWTSAYLRIIGRDELVNMENLVDLVAGEKRKKYYVHYRAMIANKKIIFFWALAWFAPLFAHAAILTVTAPVIALDTQGQYINAIELHITFDPGEFSIDAIDDGGSVVTAWIAKPAFSNVLGTVDLSGIIPGGINTANGKIVSFAIAPKQTGMVKGFVVQSGQILLNDGKGTPASLSVVSGPFPLENATSVVLGNMSVDFHAPDPFVPEVARDPALFGGKYFLVFNTTDQGSGIDRYEVLEVPQGESAGDITTWRSATSPYLLHDQTLKSDIYVRAVDNAGNLRMVKIAAATPENAMPAPRQSQLPMVGLGILLVTIVTGISWYLWKRKAHG